jgi:peroxiredoxin
MPIFQQFYDVHNNELQVLAVNADESIIDVRTFVEDQKLTYPILLDPGGKVQELYRMRGYPTTVFIDANGIIQVIHIGTLSEKQVEEYLMILEVSK